MLQSKQSLTRSEQPLTRYEYEIVITVKQVLSGGREGYDTDNIQNFVMHVWMDKRDGDQSWMSGELSPDEFKDFGLTSPQVNKYLFEKYNYLPVAGEIITGITKRLLIKKQVFGKDDL